MGVFLSQREGVLRTSGDGDERGIWIGLKFLILGFFGVGKLRTFLCRGRGGGTLDLSRDFSGIQNNLRFRGSACVSRAYGSANKVQRAMSFFGPGIFSDFVGNPRDFFLGGGGSWIFLPIRSCPSLEIWALEFVQLVVRFMHCNLYLKSFSITTGNLGDLRCNLKGIHWYIILNCHNEGSTRVSINERKIYKYKSIAL